ncbi:acyl-CoA thioesterase [Erythrobacter litoralis]|uniref:Putative thioesterase protein n=1 Tax=Erythrobacter litoralis (strain HTCC2594) TaxID=314225 RepID=Q2N645_ERYLH|nr:thioesterase family protein [Erythrobacter litoralis]ABC64846.1 putative thioesterase protein [Erythrobacter litoralis HTCC2594]
MTEPFRHRLHVRYAETDPQGVVFNSRYLEYADVLVTEYWESVGLGFTGEDALEFHVAQANVGFVKPIRLREWIEGRAVTTKIGNSSMAQRIELHGEEGEDDLRAVIELVQVHVDLATGKPQRIPDSVRAMFAGSIEAHADEASPA